MKEKIEFILRIKGTKSYEFNDERTFTVEMTRDEAHLIFRRLCVGFVRREKAEQRKSSLREQADEKGIDEVLIHS